MADKHEIAHADTAKNPDGTYNLDHIEATAVKAMANLRNGHAVIENFEETTSPSGGRRLILDVKGH